MDDKKILDVTCGSRTIWFNKEHPAAVYCDIREEELTGMKMRTMYCFTDTLRDCVFGKSLKRWIVQNSGFISCMGEH